MTNLWVTVFLSIFFHQVVGYDHKELKELCYSIHKDDTDIVYLINQKGLLADLDPKIAAVVYADSEGPELYSCISCCYTVSTDVKTAISFVSTTLRSSELKDRTWIFTFASEDDMREFLPALQSVELLLTSHIYLWTPLTVYEAYKISSRLSVLPYGTRRAPEDAFAFKTTSIWERRKDLLGEPIRVTSGPYIFFQTGITDTGRIEGGATKFIFDSLERMLNFTYVPILPFDGEWNKDGVLQFYGYGIGFTNNNHCDVFADVHSTTIERAQFVDFTNVLIESPAFMTVGRKPVLDFPTFYNRTFTTEAWLCYLAITVSFIVGLYLVFSHQWGMKRRDGLTSRLTTDCIILGLITSSAEAHSTPKEVFLTSVGHACQAYGNILNCEEKKGSFAVRVFFFTLLATGYVFNVFYVGDMSSYFTVEQDVIPFTSLQGLYDSEYTLAVIKDQVTMFTFAQAKKGSLQNKIWEQKIKPYEENIFKEPYDYWKLTKERVAVVNLVDAYNTHPGYPCQFWPVGQPVIKFPFAYPVRKGFQFLPLINWALGKLEESGTLSTMISRARADFYGTPRSENDCKRESKQIGITDTKLPFTVLAIGVGSGLIFIGVEMVIRVYMKRVRAVSFRKTNYDNLVF